MQRLLFLMQALLISLVSSEVPMVMEYQGQLLESKTNRAVTGAQSRNMLFILSEVGGTELFTYSAPSVAIRDGHFRVEIPIPQSIRFDRPYAINVLLQGEGGAQTGSQPLKTVPYALSSRDAFQLDGVDASEFSLAAHVHTTSSGKIFTIDGVNQSLLPGDPQFTILDEGGRILFRVNAQGSLERVHQVSAGGTIETSGTFSVTQGGVEKFRADPDSQIRFASDLQLTGQAVVEAIDVSETTTASDLQVRKVLELGPEVQLNVVTNNGNAFGLAHTLEDHASSELLEKLTSLASGAQVTAGLHTHSFEAAQITSQALLADAVEAIHIATGALFDADISPTAQILDSRLATISSTGRVTTSALPSSVVLKGQNNVFGAGFGPSGLDQILTTNSFDQLEVTELLVSAPQVLGTQPMVEFTNQAGEFFWRLYRDGRVSLRAAGGTTEVFSIEVTENDTKFDLKAVDLILKEGHLIEGDVISDGSLSSADLAAGQLEGSDITDGSVVASKVSSQSVTTAKLVPGAILSAKITGLSVRSRHLQGGAISASKVATGAIVGQKILNGTLTGQVVGNAQITGTRIANGELGTAEVRDGSMNENVLAAEDQGSGVFPMTGAKLESATLGPETLKPDVLEDRARPALISSTPSTIQTPFLRLRSDTANQRLIQMQVDQIQSLPIPSIHMLTALLSGGNRKQFALNMDGSMTLRGANLSDAVTLPGDVLATLSGASKPSGQCPVNDDYEHVTVGGSALNSGNGFCIRRFANSGASGYASGSFDCPSSGVTGIQGARLCSMDEVRMACQAGKISSAGAIMTSDLGYGGGQLRYQQLNVTSTEPCQVAIASQNTGTVGAYACCFVPR